MKRVARRLLRYGAYTAAVAGLLLLAAVLGLRLWYPNLSDHKGTLERYLSQVVKRPVVVQALHTEWEGLSPVLRASGLRVRRQDGSHSTVRLGTLDLKVNLLALAIGKLEFNNLTLTGPTVAVMRMLDGRIRVGDFVSGERTGGHSTDALRWLSQQPSVNVRDGTLVWQDEREPHRILQLDRVNIALSRQHREHRFSGTAVLPRDLAEDLKLDGVLKGAPFSAGGFDGTVNVRVSGLNIDALPLQVRELAPWLRRGHVSAEVSSSWVAGALSGAVADIEIQEFTVPYGEPQQLLSPHRFASHVSLHHGGDGWRISFIQPEFELYAGEVLRANQLVLERVGNARIYNAENVNLDGFVRTVRQLEINVPWPKLLSHTDPQGVLNTVTLTVQGPFLRSRNWRFEGQFKELGWKPHDRLPGMTGINGSTVVDGRHGVLTLQSDNLRLTYPHALDETLEFDRLNADLQWTRSAGTWALGVDELLLGNGELQIEMRNANAEIVEADPLASFLDASIEVPFLRVGALRRYLPLKLMPEKPREWLQRALVSGIANDGKVEFNGRLREFPFRSGGGRFHASARITDGILDYQERWPRLENINGTLALRNVLFSGKLQSGGIMNSRIARARVESEDMFVRTRLLKVHGHIDGPVDDIVEFLLRGPFNDRPRDKTLDLNGTGRGSGDVSIELPFTRLKEESRVTGTFHTEDAGLVFGSGIEISGIAGEVDFTDRTVSGRGLQGRMFGGPVKFDISTVHPGRPPVFAVDARGRGQPGLLSPVLGDKLVEYLSGDTEWKGRLQVDRGEASLAVESLLTGAESRLPPPLAKQAKDPMPVAAGVDFLREGRQSVRFSVGERLSGTLDFESGERGLLLDRGQIAMGDAAGPATVSGPGLRVVVEHDRLDADAWISTLESFRDPAQAALPADDPARKPSLFDAMRALDLDTESFILQSRNLGQLQLSATSSDSRHWRATLQGESAQGEAGMTLDPAGNALRLTLSRLFWPRAAEGQSPPAEGSEDPAAYLALDITAQRFQFAEMTLGTLELRAGPQGRSWRVDKLRVDQPAMTLEADGEWVPTASGQQTRFRSRTTMHDMGRALKQLGFPGHVSGGSAEITADIDWPGSPGAFDFARLNGAFDLEARKGQFLNVEPGSGRLLGLFNVEAFTRRLSLDFSDIFSKGLTFDSIAGTGTIREGDLLSDSVLVVSTAALIEASGRAGLDTEDYDMNVIVAPQVGTNLSLLGALANPAAGAVIFLMQKVFKKQLAEMVHYRYHVTGPWDEPEVVRTAGSPDADLNDEVVSDAAAEG